tara:strand:+ start:375 stop:584 length:210 start_codon:yes stop_codon:yes gene_type:complete
MERLLQMSKDELIEELDWHSEIREEAKSRIEDLKDAGAPADYYGYKYCNNKIKVATQCIDKIKLVYASA